MATPVPHRDPLESSPTPTRWWIGGVYLGLFAVSVPWYLPAADPVPIWFGLPHWVVLSIAGCVAVALFTALVVVRYWPDDLPSEPRGPSS